jgi:hypothetical protein
MGISAPAGSLREIRGLRGELGQFAKRMSENNSSLRSEIAPLRSEMRAEIRVLNTRIDAVGNQLNTRIDALGMQVNARIDELTQRLDDALNVRQRLIAVEAKLAGRNSWLGQIPIRAASPVAGVDEVGVGALAGPVIAAALRRFQARLLRDWQIPSCSPRSNARRCSRQSPAMRLQSGWGALRQRK